MYFLAEADHGRGNAVFGQPLQAVAADWRFFLNATKAA
jgi:hypothetical protein